MRRLLAPALVVLLAACGGAGGDGVATVESSTPSAADAGGTTAAPSASSEATAVGSTAVGGAPYLGALTYAWKAGCDADVEEKVVKRGQRATLHYTLRVLEHPDGLRVALSGMEVRESNGKVVPAAQRKVLAAGFRLPDFVVDPAGDVVDLDGFDEMLDDLIALDERYAALDSAVLRATLEESIGTKYWGVWAGTWAALGSVDEAKFSGVVPVSVDGVSVDAEVVVESLPVDPSSATPQARLKTTETMSGPALGTVAAKLLESLGPSKIGDVGSLRRTVVTDVVTDPTTLRPSETNLDVTLLATRDGETTGDQETRHTTFTWSGNGC